MIRDNDPGRSHMLRRLAVLLLVIAEAGTFIPARAGTVVLAIPFDMELWAVAVPLNKKAIVEYGTNLFVGLLFFFLKLVTE